MHLLAALPTFRLEDDHSTPSATFAKCGYVRKTKGKSVNQKKTNKGKWKKANRADNCWQMSFHRKVQPVVTQVITPGHTGCLCVADSQLSDVHVAEVFNSTLLQAHGKKRTEQSGLEPGWHVRLFFHINSSLAHKELPLLLATLHNKSPIQIDFL